MGNGYAGKLLEVDLKDEKTIDVKFSGTFLKNWIGGRSLATKILWDRLGKRWANIDPLGPENIFFALAGPMTGYYPGMRICISGKSPQSNGIIGSTVAGEFALELKCSGYDGVIITGKADQPVYIYIENGNISIKDASRLWGKDAKQTIRLINKEVIENLESERGKERMWREPGIIYIGPAGENKSRMASVCQKWTHAAGYGGYGGVMGSKNLKAIVVKGTGPLPEPMDIKKTIELRNEVVKACLASDLQRRWGTGSAGYEVGAAYSCEPIKNWQEEWHDETSFGVDHFERRVWMKRYWGDYSCPTTCLKISCIRDGPMKGAITDNPDYEIQAYMGTNLGIFEPEGNVYLAAIADDLGLCGIQVGNVLGFAAELYQRGILLKEDVGFELNWGDPVAFGKLAEMVAKREGIGDVLAEGTFRAAVKIGKMKGVDLLPYAVHEKGVAVGAWGLRSGLGYVHPAGYVTSVQGGDHTSLGDFTPDEEGDINWGFLDSAVICGFNVQSNKLLWELFRAITGWDTTVEDWNNTLGPRMLSIQRTVLLAGGPDFSWNPDKDDENPARWYEPLPNGPYKGKTVDQNEVISRKKIYYESLGWDERGIPTVGTLKRLDLMELDETLSKMRK
jgi:aldehyde:ferredoxin oxidoreductase